MKSETVSTQKSEPLFAPLHPVIILCYTYVARTHRVYFHATLAKSRKRQLKIVIERGKGDDRDKPGI